MLLAGLSKKVASFQRPLQAADTHEGTLGGKTQQMPGKLISIYRYQHVATAAAHWPYKKKFRDLSIMVRDAVWSGKYFPTFRSYVQPLHSRPYVHEDGEIKVIGNFGYLAKHTPPRASTVIPRLTKIIRSGITFVSRNVISHKFL